MATVGCKVEDERMELVVLEESLHRVQSLLEALGVNRDRPWVVIHPGATALSRRYPTVTWQSQSTTY